MKKPLLAVCDSNEKYVFRLQEYLNTHKLLPYLIRVFTEWGSFRAFVENDSAEASVIGPAFWENEKSQGMGRIIRLCDEEEEEDEEAIYRFRSIEYFAKRVCEIMHCEPSRRNDTGIAGSKTKLIGVYSPIKRCLQTSFSIVLGEILSKRNRVLYMNFEAFSGLGVMMRREFTSDMSDLLYYFRNMHGNFATQLKNVIQNYNEMDFIPPPLSYMDTSQISALEWMNLLKEISKGEEYDYLILDLSEHLQGLFEILRYCDRVFTITGNNKVAEAKQLQYEMLLQETSFEDVMKKTTKCNFPIFQNIPVDADRLLYSELAEHVRKYIKEEM